nr:MAG TPA: hypothetical protein [Caudoviricetes sp.]
MSVPCIHGCPDYRACGRCQRTLTIQQARMNRTSPRARLRGAGRSGTSGETAAAGPPGQGALPGLGDRELDAARDLAAREAAERARQRARRALTDIQAARARRQAQAGQAQARATRALLAETMAHLRTTQGW